MLPDSCPVDVNQLVLGGLSRGQQMRWRGLEGGLQTPSRIPCAPQKDAVKGV